MYTIEGLEHGIERCKHNITVLESAIEKERQTIKEYRAMIEGIETAERDKERAKADIKVEVVRE